jgi:hypothetical protein
MQSTFITHEMHELSMLAHGKGFDCVICMDETTKLTLCIPICGHKYCKTCLSKLTRCAVCRANIVGVTKPSEELQSDDTADDADVADDADGADDADDADDAEALINIGTTIIPATGSIVRVANLPSYANREDIYHVFKSCGTIIAITVRNETAMVQFSSAIEAYYAKRRYHMLPLDGYYMCISLW